MENQNTNMPQNISDSGNISSSGINNSYKDVVYQLEQAIGADVAKLNDLVKKGIITQKQGQYLMTQLAKKTLEINNYKKSLTQQQAKNEITNPDAEQQNSMTNPLDEFLKENPTSFDGDARQNVLEYLKTCNIDKDEVSKIVQMIELLEQTAVDNYMKNLNYEKSLNDENDLAKSKLNTYAQNANANENTNRIYTRNDIGNMSGSEFTKNEKQIMEQLKQGLIK